MELKNSRLQPVNVYLKYLVESGVPAKVNRAAFMLNQKLGSLVEEQFASQKRLLESYGLSPDDDGNYSIADLDAETQAKVNQELQEGLAETAIVEPSYKEQFIVLKEFIEEYEGIIPSEQTVGFNFLYDALATQDN